jgi:hypothetical protein
VGGMRYESTGFPALSHGFLPSALASLHLTEVDTGQGHPVAPGEGTHPEPDCFE